MARRTSGRREKRKINEKTNLIKVEAQRIFLRRIKRIRQGEGLTVRLSANQMTSLIHELENLNQANGSLKSISKDHF